MTALVGLTVQQGCACALVLRQTQCSQLKPRGDEEQPCLRQGAQQSHVRSVYEAMACVGQWEWLVWQCLEVFLDLSVWLPAPPSLYTWGGKALLRVTCSVSGCGRP